MENIFLCNFCKSEFNDIQNTPRVLDCGHSVCTPCLGKIFLKDLCCPNCKMKVTGKVNFPVNLSLLDMMKACEPCKVSDDTVNFTQKLIEKYTMTKEFLFEKEAVIKSELEIIENGLERLKDLYDSENSCSSLGNIKESLLTLENHYESTNTKNFSYFGIAKDFATISLDSFKENDDYLQEIYSKLKKDEKIYAVELIENSLRFAQLSERDNMVLMHSFSHSEVPHNASVILFSELKRCFFSKRLCTFLKVSTSKKNVTHLIIIEMVWNSPISFDFVKLCTGECGPSYKNSSYCEGFNKEKNIQKIVDFVFNKPEAYINNCDENEILKNEGFNKEKNIQNKVDFVFTKPEAYINNCDENKILKNEGFNKEKNIQNIVDFVFTKPEAYINNCDENEILKNETNSVEFDNSINATKDKDIGFAFLPTGKELNDIIVKGESISSTSLESSANVNFGSTTSNVSFSTNSICNSTANSLKGSRNNSESKKISDLSSQACGLFGSTKPVNNSDSTKPLGSSQLSESFGSNYFASGTSSNKENNVGSNEASQNTFTFGLPSNYNLQFNKTKSGNDDEISKDNTTKDKDIGLAFVPSVKEPNDKLGKEEFITSTSSGFKFKFEFPTSNVSFSTNSVCNSTVNSLKGSRNNSESMDTSDSSSQTCGWFGPTKPVDNSDSTKPLGSSQSSELFGSNYFASGTSSNKENNVGSNKTFQTTKLDKIKTNDFSKSKTKSNVLKPVTFFNLPSNFIFPSCKTKSGNDDETSKNKADSIFQPCDRNSVKLDNKLSSNIILRVEKNDKLMLHQKLNFDYYHKALGTSLGHCTTYQEGDIIVLPGLDYSFNLFRLKKSWIFKAIGKVIYPLNLSSFISYEDPSKLKVLDCGILFEM